MPSPKKTAKRRRWASFSLRTFLLVVFPLVAVVSWYANAVRTQQTAFDVLTNNGVVVSLEPSDYPWSWNRPVPRRLRDMLPDHYHRRISDVTMKGLEPDQVVEACRVLPELKQLRRLHIYLDIDAVK